MGASIPNTHADQNTRLNITLLSVESLMYSSASHFEFMDNVSLRKENRIMLQLFSKIFYQFFNSHDFFRSGKVLHKVLHYYTQNNKSSSTFTVVVALYGTSYNYYIHNIQYMLLQRSVFKPSYSKRPPASSAHSDTAHATHADSAALETTGVKASTNSTPCHQQCVRLYIHI